MKNGQNETPSRGKELKKHPWFVFKCRHKNVSFGHSLLKYGSYILWKSVFQDDHYNFTQQVLYDGLKATANCPQCTDFSDDITNFNRKNNQVYK